MALIKTDGLITDIKGSVGGTVFSRDASGLHATATPRSVKRTPSAAQTDQKDWYRSLKRAEHYPVEEEPYPIEEIPPGTHLIYSLEVIWGHRQPSLTNPVKTAVVYTGFDMDVIQIWITNNWKPSYLLFGLTQELMFLMMAKWYWILRGTMGFGGGVAVLGAQVNMTNFISAAAASTAIPFVALWGGLIALQFYFAFTSWLEGQNGFISFTKGRVLIQKDTTTWWGGLIGRPSKAMYDFAICGVSPYDGNIWRTIRDVHPYRINFFETHGLWQTVSRRFLIWYIYTYGLIRVRFRGKGYLLKGNRLRMNVNQSQVKYWGKEIGWAQPNAAGCAYLSQFDEHWQYQGHPADPL